MGQLRCESIFSKMKKIVPDYIAIFIEWYCQPKETRISFEELQKKDTHIKSIEICMDWLKREDAQNSMQLYYKHMMKYNLMKLYEAMFEKALQGDVNAAKWIESFSHSDFFDDSTDEIDNFMNDVNIPALKGGGKNGSK